ncbi:hypothetical protein ES703_102186 [subsurface metagenome]
MIAVINASPLIYLSKLGVIEILPKLFKKIVTTPAVKQEVLQEENAPEHTILNEIFNQWLEVTTVKGEVVKSLLKLQIHRGEAEIIALGRKLQTQEKTVVILIDDLLAREIANSLGLMVTGTVGTLLRALKMKEITRKKCRTLMEQLITTTDFRLSAKLYARIIREIERIE